MINIHPTNLVSAVDMMGDPRLRYQSGGISDELYMIANLLKEGLDGFCAWIQLFALLPSTGSVFFETAARELNRMVEHFAQAYAKLTAYGQQVPQSKDAAVALEMEKNIGQIFGESLRKETPCEIGGEWTSWGALIDPRIKTAWLPETTLQLLSEITPLAWNQAKNQLSQLRSTLP